ncbi:unnamed protein product [Ilex paraguariensis]|uniref:Cytochrome P450 n=1 Tax=Ilex paraguariensis TaxID=185542 RepID=A0ABC8UHD2_9AQUA
MHLQLGEVAAVVISSPEAAKEVMKTHDLIFASRPEILAFKIFSYNFTNMAFAPYGNYWRQLQKICILELLSAKRIQSYESIREEEVWNLIESISSSQGLPINLSRKIFSLTNTITSTAAFGIKCKDQDEFITTIQEAVKLSGGFDLPDVSPSLKFLHSINRVKPALEKMHQKIDKILDNIIDDHTSRKAMIISSDKSRKEDLLDVLLNRQPQICQARKALSFLSQPTTSNLSFWYV